MLTVGSANIYSFLHEESFVPSWRKFLSTMVERKIPHIGKNKVIRRLCFSGKSYRFLIGYTPLPPAHSYMQAG